MAGPGCLRRGDNYLHINGGYIVIDAYGDGLDVNGPVEMTLTARPERIFSITIPVKRCVSCSTMPIEARRLSRRMCSISIPSEVTRSWSIS
jgi:hypothetical protein